MSAFFEEDNCKKFFLDGHNNPGFSGGPVVFSEPGKPANQLNVAAVVSAYPAYRELVYDSEGNETGQYILENPGIIIAHDIEHAVELITANPVGFQL